MNGESATALPLADLKMLVEKNTFLKIYRWLYRTIRNLVVRIVLFLLEGKVSLLAGKIKKTGHASKLCIISCIIWRGARTSLFLYRFALSFSFPFFASYPESFKHPKSLVSWGPFILSKNRFRLKSFRFQDLPTPLPPGQIAPRVLSDLQKKKLFMITRAFLDLKKYSSLRALPLFPKM